MRSSLVTAALVAVGAFWASLSAAPGARESGRTELRFLSARALTIVTDHPANRACAEGAHDVRLEFGDGSLARPVTTGLDCQVVALSATATPRIERRLHLLFADPIPASVPFDVRIDGDTHRVVYAPADSARAIQVNQVGYAPGAAKFAYVGGWLGTAGPLPLDAERFEVVDQLGRVAYEGPLALRRAADPWSGNDVYEADFSVLARPGRYRLRVAGVGVSDPFDIHGRVYDGVYRRVARLLYHSRNGTPIERPWADPEYERAGGIPGAMDASIHPRVRDSVLGPGPGDPTRRDVRGGWFDAGDYGQYVTNAAPVWYVVAAALDLAPENFRDGDLGIPESGNGIPDVIDELEWGMDWALTMQAADGGVFWRLASRRWDDGLPATVSEPRLLAERTTHATAVFAAMAAINARLLRPMRAERADRLLRAAESAWRFVEDRPQYPAEGERFVNPEGVAAGEYPDRSARDARAWAAAELFRTTRERAYLEAFDGLFAGLKLDPTAPVSFHDQGMAAAWAYLMTPDPRRDPDLVERARRALLAGADWRLEQMESHPFRAPQHPAIQLTGWGSFAHSTRATLPLLQAWSITGEVRYRRGAWVTTDVQLGANPQGLSYITGIGARWPRHPLSKLSQYDDVAEPLQGIPVNGPHFHLPAIWDSTRAVNAGYFPPAASTGASLSANYPALRRYTDSELLPPMNEPTVAEIARTAVAFGLLRDEARAFGPATGPR
jgi:hypothetical protein